MDPTSKALHLLDSPGSVPDAADVTAILAGARSVPAA